MITINGHKLKPTLFPDQCSQVWQLPQWLFEHRSYWIDWRWENESEILQLVQLVHLICVENAAYASNITLYVPYLPYARQDKALLNKETFGLRSFGHILNTLNLKSIITLDVHNEEAAHNNIRNLQNRVPVDFHYRVLNNLPDLKYDCIVFPDMGAWRRYSHLHQYPHVVFRKSRDPETGQVKGHELHADGETAKKAKRFIVIDDICDGGATFTSVAEALEILILRQPVQLDLAVTHGIFSKGFAKLNDDYTNFYHTNSLGNVAGGFEV